MTSELFKLNSQDMSGPFRFVLTLSQRAWVISGKAIVEVFVNPLVRWVWLGGFVMFFGTLLALVPSRAERQMAEIRQMQETAVRTAHAK
jgi:hypothetical protein